MEQKLSKTFFRENFNMFSSISFGFSDKFKWTFPCSRYYNWRYWPSTVGYHEFSILKIFKRFDVRKKKVWCSKRCVKSLCELKNSKSLFHTLDYNSASIKTSFGPIASWHTRRPCRYITTCIINHSCFLASSLTNFFLFNPTFFKIMLKIYSIYRTRIISWYNFVVM